MPAQTRRPSSPSTRRRVRGRDGRLSARSRADAAQDAVGAHQPRGRNRLDQVLGHQRIDGRHPGDVDNRDLGARSHDLFQQALHDDLCALAVERADQRQRQNAFPEPDHRGREFEQFLLLACDDLLAAALVQLGHIEAEPVEQSRGGPDLPGSAAIPGQLARNQREQRLLEREDEHRGFGRGETERGARGRQLFELTARIGPARSRNVVQTAVFNAVPEGSQKTARLLAQLAFAYRSAAEPRHAALLPQPFVEEAVSALIDQPGNQVFCRVIHFRSVTVVRCRPASQRIVSAILLTLATPTIGGIILPSRSPATANAVSEPIL